MKNAVAKMADFVTGTGFDDLPPEVIHEMKRVILDSVGCAIIGQTTERGEAAVKLAQRLAGPPESTIFGTNSKVSCTNAAFANGESMNALDYDALSAAAVHDVPVLVPAVLAMAESTGSAGKDVLLALALSFEISARLKAAGAQAKTAAGEAPRAGLQWSPVLGYSAVTLAAAAGTGRILNLDMQEMANAMGIAGGICPPNIFRKFTDTSPINMIKYASTGWEAQAGITAALLAETGYTGDTDLFQGDYGYWNYTGMGDVKEEVMRELLEDLGSQWQSYKINYKQYPCCGHISGTMDQFIRIINEHDISPEEVTGITAYMDSLSQFRVFKENVLQTPDDYCFSAPYLFACAVHRIDPVYWHTTEVKEDAVLQKFMQRVRVSIIVNENDPGITKKEPGRESSMSIEVTAGGKTYREKVSAMKGAWQPETCRNTDEELVQKFSSNAARVLPENRPGKAAELILQLDTLDTLAPIIESITP